MLNDCTVVIVQYLYAVLVLCLYCMLLHWLQVSSAGGEDDLDFESVEANLREGGDLKWTIIRTGPLSSEVRT